MTEQDFIYATDYRTICYIKEMLFSLIPQNNVAITEDELITIKRILHIWETRSLSIIKIEDEE